jgi:hypothetical protein
MMQQPPRGRQMQQAPPGGRPQQQSGPVPAKAKAAKKVHKVLTRFYFVEKCTDTFYHLGSRL